MKLTSILCLALLVLGTYAVTEEQEAVQRLSQMEKTRFGKTILDTIQIQMASGDAVEDLIELLKDTESNIDAEQKDDDAYILKVRADCQSEIARLNSEIQAAKDRSAELQAEIDEKTPIRDEKEELLGEKNELADHTGDRIVELDEDKAEHDADWSAEQQEHDRATYVIERAKEVIENGFAGSFLQKSFKPQALVQVSEHFKSNSKTFKRNSWNQIFKLLAQITASAPIQADGNAIQKILNLIDNLLEKIAESREIERREYEAWVAEYDDARAAAVALLEATNVQIFNLEGEISALNKRLANAADERDEQNERAHSKKTELEGRIKWCDDESESYAERREARMDNRKTVSDAIGLIESKLRILQDFVKQRLG